MSDFFNFPLYKLCDETPPARRELFPMRLSAGHPQSLKKSAPCVCRRLLMQMKASVSARKGSDGTMISSKRRPCSSLAVPEGRQIAGFCHADPGSHKFVVGRQENAKVGWPPGRLFPDLGPLRSARKQGKFFGQRGVDTA